VFSLGALRSLDPVRHTVRTTAGGAMAYDAVLLAHGAVPTPALPGALTFRGPADAEKVAALLGELERGSVRRVAFVVPWGAVWSLPAYELALLTSARAEELGLADVELSLVTPEGAPLEIFGDVASAAVADLLAERGIDVHAGAYPLDVRDGELRFAPEGSLPVDRVVALPRLKGQRIDGLPATADGFLPVDEHGRVPGVDDVFAAGDATSFPVKQGGIAAQQADAAAEAIARLAGVELTPRPFRPVLRGLLLTGGRPQFLSNELGHERREPSAASGDALWWPPSKIVGHYLAPFLAGLVGVEEPEPVPPTMPPGAVRVDRELGERDLARLRPHGLESAVERDPEPGERAARTAAGVMSPVSLVVEPSDTLGEVAERMRERDVGTALVCDYGRLIGILTSRDLLRAFAGRVHPSEARVREWMTADPVTVAPTTSVEAAAVLMADYAIHHLPVVEGDRPVGVLGMRDVVRSTTPSSPIRVGLGF